jgi:hypothetical protein
LARPLNFPFTEPTPELGLELQRPRYASDQADADLSRLAPFQFSRHALEKRIASSVRNRRRGVPHRGQFFVGQTQCH